MKILAFSLALTLLPTCADAARGPDQAPARDAGIVPDPPDRCVLPSSLSALVSTETLLVNRTTLTRESWVSSETQAELSVLVTRVPAAGVGAVHGGDLGSVLDHYGVEHLDRVIAYDVPGARSFVLLTVPGLQPRGLVFADTSTTVVATIDDGSISRCPAVVARCRLDSTFGALGSDPRFDTLEERTFTAHERIDPLTAERAIAAARVADPRVTTLDAAFEVADGHEMRRIVRREHADSATFVSIDYGAGDNTYGAIFEHGARPVVEIRDGDHYACRVLDRMLDAAGAKRDAEPAQ